MSGNLKMVQHRTMLTMDDQ